MKCNVCDAETKVVDSRSTDAGAGVRRRRRCCSCNHAFTTYERVASVSPRRLRDAHASIVRANGEIVKLADELGAMIAAAEAE